MRISSTNQPGKIGNGGKARAPSGASGVFKAPQTSQTAGAQKSSSTAAIAGVDALLALQSVNPDGGRRAKAVKRGHSLLDVLEDLRLDLLAGNISELKLRKLLHLVREGSLATENPLLDEVIGEIELRARVELAKRGLPDK